MKLELLIAVPKELYKVHGIPVYQEKVILIRRAIYVSESQCDPLVQLQLN